MIGCSQPILLKMAKAIRKNHSIKEQLILRVITELPDQIIIQLAKKWQTRGLKYPVRAENFFRQLLMASKISQRKQKPKAPLMILASEKDKIVHPDCSRKIAKTWKMPVITHSQAGHDVALDDPEWIIQQLDKFLKKNKPN